MNKKIRPNWFGITMSVNYTRELSLCIRELNLFYQN